MGVEGGDRVEKGWWREGERSTNNYNTRAQTLRSTDVNPHFSSGDFEARQSGKMVVLLDLLEEAVDTTHTHTHTHTNKQTQAQTQTQHRTHGQAVEGSKVLVFTQSLVRDR